MSFEGDENDLASLVINEINEALNIWILTAPANIIELMTAFRPEIDFFENSTVTTSGFALSPSGSSPWVPIWSSSGTAILVFLRGSDSAEMLADVFRLAPEGSAISAGFLGNLEDSVKTFISGGSVVPASKYLW